MDRLKRVFWGVIVGFIIVGTAGYVHLKIHEIDAPRVRSKTQIQERKVVHVETITQKILLEE